MTDRRTGRPPKRRGLRLGLAVLAALSVPGPGAPAQVLGGVRLPGVAGALPPLGLAPPLQSLARDLSPGALLEARRVRLDDFVRAHRRTVETDEARQPVVRGAVLALDPSVETLAAAQQAGFSVTQHGDPDALGIRAVVLAAPAGVPATRALKLLRAIDPRGSFDYDHLYFGAGAAERAVSGSASVANRSPAAASKPRVGLIDTGVETRNPALAGVRVETRGFAPGAPRVGPHGTATASLIAGRTGGFHGAAPGASLWAADVYGAGEGGGDALAISRALAWMAQARVPVVSISLVGPANRLIEASVRALSQRGVIVVAAVGNDGPAAPPMYPASYPEVVAVSAVDGRGRPLPEAGHATHVDFCAPGADMAAAVGPSGFASVRGTSFAAPLVAGLLAEQMTEPAPARARQVLAALALQAASAPVRANCGSGIVAATLRTPPTVVHARAWPED